MLDLYDLISTSVCQFDYDQRRGFYRCWKRWFSWFRYPFFGCFVLEMGLAVDSGAGFGVISSGG